jgi:hypothetical protein
MPVIGNMIEINFFNQALCKGFNRLCIIDLCISNVFAFLFLANVRSKKTWIFSALSFQHRLKLNTIDMNSDFPSINTDCLVCLVEILFIILFIES